ncbi:MAG: NADP-dependent malic enzyme [Oscillospiraceae bacterium]|jgi:malate dehydrogenase (oxaloacetate-decarboxylating)|nr:NADP-dependent malic enzyme [Oscillospiraceae bacterium]
MDYSKLSSDLHRQWRGKFEIVPKMPITTREELSVAYTPGVAAPCLEIAANKELVYDLTGRGNTVAVITDGSAVLGLGNIGPEASMPVMEGKCVLFKAFGGVDAVPICLDTQEPDEIVEAVVRIHKSFGGINLEDISAPRCFEIEEKLKARCEIPVFHDDQHGTAVVVAAALLGAAEVVAKPVETLRVVISGAGAAGIAVCRLLGKIGVRDIILCDTKGPIYEGRAGLNAVKEQIAKTTNRDAIAGALADALRGADVFIGVSAPGIVTEDMVRSMAKSPIVFALSNPVPEITPEAAKAAGAAVIGTGRSDYQNQINNVLAFPGIFKGAFAVRASDINDEMKIAAAQALFALAKDKLTADYIIPEPFDTRVADAVAAAVAQAAVDTGVARKPLQLKE